MFTHSTAIICLTAIIKVSSKSSKEKQEEAFIFHGENEDPDGEFVSENFWGFTEENEMETGHPSESMTKNEKESTLSTQKQQIFEPETAKINPYHNGLLKDIGNIDIGFGVNVGVPNNDPVSVGAKVGVELGTSGLAGGLPIGQNIYPRQGERYSLNDYDGNKQLILPGKATRYIEAIRKGIIRPLRYPPPHSLVGLNGGIGIGR